MTRRVNLAPGVRAIRRTVFGLASVVVPDPVTGSPLVVRLVVLR
ncbi:hypothetical protein [Streptomyces sp. IBSBF 2435]